MSRNQVKQRILDFLNTEPGTYIQLENEEIEEEFRRLTSNQEDE